MGLKHVVWVLGKLVAAGVGVVASMSLLGLFGEAWWVLDLFSHFRVQLGVALVLLVGCALALRMPRVARTGAVLALLNFLIISPQLVYQPTAEARRPDAVRLAHANVNHYNTDFASALEFFETTEPDVLVIVEANPRWVAALEPLERSMPYVFDETHGRFGVAVWSRYPMSAESVYFTRHNPSAVARIATPSGAVRVIGTHPRSPASAGRARRRDAQLAAIGAFVKAEGGPTVLLGDLNTTPWGHAFRSLVAESGLRDTSRGVGYQWTWPAKFWPLAIPIDHALVSDEVRTLDRRIGPSIGSDHLPLVLDIALEPR